MDLTVWLSYRAAHRRNVKTWIARERSGIGEGECDGPNKNWDTRLNFLNPMFEEEILGAYKLDNNANLFWYCPYLELKKSHNLTMKSFIESGAENSDFF